MDVSRTYLHETTFNTFGDNPQGSSEYNRTGVRTESRMDMSHAVFLFPGLRYPYHSRRVIARSASRSGVIATTREPLARATSGSLTTRIPKKLLNRPGLKPWNEVPLRIYPSDACHAGRFRGFRGRVGVRVTSNTRTYRRVEVKQREVRTNSGKTEARRLKDPARVKAALSPNLGKTVILNKDMEDQRYILQDRDGDYVKDVSRTDFDTAKTHFTFTKEKEKARRFTKDDLWSRLETTPLGIEFARGYAGRAIRI